MHQQIGCRLFGLSHHFAVVRLFFLFGKKFQCMECEGRQVFRTDIAGDVFKRNQRFGKCMADFSCVGVISFGCAVRYGQT